MAPLTPDAHEQSEHRDQNPGPAQTDVEGFNDRLGPRQEPPRIHGELLMLGFDVAQSTVAKYMVARSGRPPSQSWKSFLRNHAAGIASIDLFAIGRLIERRRRLPSQDLHGETAWSISGQQTGLTDLPLTEWGRRNATRLGERLKGLTLAKVFHQSVAARSHHTCEPAGFGGTAQSDRDLVEWE